MTFIKKIKEKTLTKDKKEESFFPILIQYTDTRRYATCKRPSDINVSKRFKIIKINVKDR